MLLLVTRLPEMKLLADEMLALTNLLADVGASKGSYMLLVSKLLAYDAA